jgi:two-component system, NarL family, nitrate/nitrite response regulator NarL
VLETRTAEGRRAAEHEGKDGRPSVRNVEDMPPIRVLIIAEPLLYREGLRFLLRAERHLEVVGATADGSAAVAQAVAVEADVVLVDMQMDGAHAIVRSIAEAAPTCSVVALGKSEGDGAVMVCLEAGAAGYLPPNGSLSDLRECINAASRGEMSCSPRIAAQLARRVACLAAELRAEQPAPPLTVREAEILELIDQGLSNKEIAQRLCIQVPTVKHHVHNILEKLKVTRRGEAAARARRGAAGSPWLGTGP